MPLASTAAEGSIDDFAAALVEDPLECFGHSAARMHAIDRATLEAIQLRALQLRFAQLRDRIPMLQKLADDLRIHELPALDSVVPLLFRHTVYKSYPISLLEKNRFTQLTQWLNKLTTFDLSGVQVSHCTSIDEWVRELDVQTPLELRYSSGTTGTMSFLPNSKRQAEQMFLWVANGFFSANNLTPPRAGAPLSMHVVHPDYRHGSTGRLRWVKHQITYLCGGDEAKFHALYPGTLSADLLFLAGRIRAAQQRGDLDRLELSPALLARRGEFEAMQRQAPSDLDRFYARMLGELRGRQVYFLGPMDMLYNMAVEGLKSGLERVFAPDSVILTGGGSKSRKLPADWELDTRRFFGVDRIVHAYGMSEVLGGHIICRHGRYHLDPTQVLFVLDPDSGAVLPRHGVRTGRAAMYDLNNSCYWGGFISGDEITVDWDSRCPCGQLSAHMSADISRYAQKGGGDDKISCAAASDAHDSALDYLVDVPA